MQDVLQAFKHTYQQHIYKTLLSNHLTPLDQAEFIALIQQAMQAGCGLVEVMTAHKEATSEILKNCKTVEAAVQLANRSIDCLQQTLLELETLAPQTKAAPHSQAATNLLLQVAIRLINLTWDEIDAGIQWALQEIACFFQVDRILVHQSAEDKSRAFLKYEWHVPTARSRPPNPEGASTTTFRWSANQLRQLKAVYVPRVADLPPEAEPERLALESLGVQTYMVVPMVYQGVAIGALSCSTHTPKIWSSEDINLLTTFGTIFVSAIVRKQAREAVRQEEQEFRALVENAPDIISRVDSEFRFQYVNPCVERETGIPAAEWMGKTETELGYPEAIVVPWQEALQQVFETGQEHYYEAEFPMLTGSQYRSCRLAPIFDSEEKVESVLAVCRDITDYKQAEKALRQSEEKFRQLAENIREVFFMRTISPEKMLYVSPTYEVVWGRSRESLYEHPESWLDTVHPDDRDHLLEALQREYIGEHAIEEYRIIRPDGSIRWISAYTSIICDEIGKPYRVVGIAEDITQRKESELALQQLNQELEHRVQQRTEALERSRAELQQREEEIRTLVENSPDIIARLDRDLRLVYINASVTPLTGMSVEDSIGKKVSELDMPPHLIQQFEAAMHQAFATGVEQILEVEYPTPSGIGWFKIRYIPEPDLKGAVTLLAIVEDITDRKRAEAALQESEEKFRQLAENIEIVFWMVSSDQQLLYVSPSYEQIWGSSVQDLYERPKAWLEALCPDDQLRLRAKLDTVFTVGYDEIYQITRSDGEIRWIRDRAFPVYDQQGNPYRVAGIAEDITHQKQAEAQIQASLKEKEILLKEIHHRVKNNLQIVSALLSFQAETIQDSQILATLQDSENRLHAMALIHEILYQAEDLGQLSFNNYIQRLADNILIANSTHANTIQLTYQLDPVSLNLETAIPCGLLLNELITNAVKHAFPKGRSGTISIRLQHVQPASAEKNRPPFVSEDLAQSAPAVATQYRLTVEDDGIGLPEGLDLKQLKSLGLRIAFDLALQLRGTLELDRCNGTRFQLTFSELKYRKRF